MNDNHSPNILVLSCTQEFCDALSAWSEPLLEKMSFLFCRSGREGLECLKINTVHYIALSLTIPDIPWITFLSMIQKQSPQIPCVLVSDQIRFENVETFQSLPIPLIFQPYVSKKFIESCINAKKYKDGNTLYPLDSMLLIEKMQKTCIIKFNSESENTGICYFRQGLLYDAVCGDSVGWEALERVKKMKKVKMTEVSVPIIYHKNIQPRIKKTISDSILNEINNPITDPNGQDFINQQLQFAPTQEAKKRFHSIVQTIDETNIVQSCVQIGTTSNDTTHKIIDKNSSPITKLLAVKSCYKELHDIFQKVDFYGCSIMTLEGEVVLSISHNNDSFYDNAGGVALLLQNFDTLSKTLGVQPYSTAFIETYHNNVFITNFSIPAHNQNFHLRQLLIVSKNIFLGQIKRRINESIQCLQRYSQRQKEEKEVVDG